MKTLKLRAPAKVNLRLDVLGKRPDGYHSVRMINSAVSIFDEVEMEIIDRGIVVECENDPLAPSGEANIAFKASKEIMAYSNKNVGVAIRIKKQIPIAAGMGGGSSDAATVLIGLNQLLKIHLPREKLIDIGARFGADIPFFLYGSPALATGIGENLSKIKRLPKMPMVIISPNVPVLTKKIYDKYQHDGINGDRDMDIPSEFSTKKALLKFLRNDLESVTARQYPVVNEIKEMLLKTGALAAQMTGSGPTVFGIYSEKADAEKALKKINAKTDGKWRVFVAENI